MAILDEAQQVLVLRILYAGPPMSGKTETLKTLARLLTGKLTNESVFSPEETQGRTLYFDWLDYTGGRFKGNAIRTQIISVPGQEALSKRRQRLLEMADVAVFIVDSQLSALESAASYFQEIQPWLQRSADTPAVNALVQANKRDLENLASVEQIREQLNAPPELKIIEATATGGSGIRETFVAAVGLALIRAQQLLSTGQLKRDKAEFENGLDLLEWMRSHEHTETLPEEPETTPETPVNLQPVRLSELITEEIAEKTTTIVEEVAEIDEEPTSLFSAAGNANAVGTDEPVESTQDDPPTTTNHEPPEATQPELIQSETIPKEPIISTPQPTSTESPPTLPNRSLPAGTVWPPVAGRVILHELSLLATSDPTLDAAGNWQTLVNGRWCILSLAHAHYERLEDARQGLVGLVRTHMQLKSLLCENRAIALAESGQGSWRLWQITDVADTFGRKLRNVISQGSPAKVADMLIQTTRHVPKFYTNCAPHYPVLQPTLDRITLRNGKVFYTGSIYPENEKTNPSCEHSAHDLEDELRILLRDPELIAQLDVPAVLHALQPMFTNADDSASRDRLKALLIGH